MNLGAIPPAARPAAPLPLNARVSDPDPFRWSRRRWLVTVGILFMAQLGLLFLLAERSVIQPQLSRSKTHFRLLANLTETELSSALWGSDPTLFVLPNIHSFSGEAWLKVLPRKYDLPDWNPAARWLDLDPTQLGDTFSRFVRNNSTNSIALAELKLQLSGSLPLLIPIETVNTQSLLRVEGELEQRLVLSVPQLVPWPHTELLASSVVEIGVDRSGEVLAARLLSRSGRPDADRNALEIARALRFQRVATDGLSWGKLTFQWHTTPATTNLTAVKPE